ncbi:undecaprenyl-diphosphate phosphatase [Lactococcus protaetiae]|uniref:Undecaprenyl-diphosphatase n=1 Tax=Lactococcus protaetiae TaxID=2592653 RepID=A0A514Z698_9LACT|nr:undecaprenyl-diphosphate phosphatase [Lactococcus protaetiae]MCL2114274.1 undecaprenyl-diphosphate phosphatase [Streptococcaceae bacterium]QDK70119.1 undecaprenyl-diphosphate phosphatase [Lactococcus protaetiae]
MDFIRAIILGIIEGITEWLPISSTGHLIIAEEFIRLNQSAAFKEMFDVVIQLGAILSVVVLYFHKLNPFNKLNPKDKQKTPREIQLTWRLWLKVLIAALPAAIIGLPLNDWLDAHFYHFVPVAFMLIIYGIAFIVIERQWVPHHEFSVFNIDRLPYRFALYIGLFQVLSLLPGTSRSGATIVGALLIGVSREVAAEFTFFLGIPVMFGASLVKIFHFFKNGNSLNLEQFSVLLLACLVAFGVSMLAIKFLMNYVKKHDFTFFGKYRIVLGAVLLVYAAVKAIVG